MTDAGGAADAAAAADTVTDDAIDDDLVEVPPIDHLFRRLGSSLHRYRGTIALSVGSVLLQTAVTVAGPAAVRYGIDHGIRGRDIGALNAAAAMFLACVVAAYFLGRATIRLVARVGEG